MRKICAFLLVLALIFCVSAQALADTVDVTRLGAIRINLKYMGQTVPGGTMTLYRVGELVQDGESYRFGLTEDFGDSGVSLEELTSQVALELADYASVNGITGTTEQIDESGYVAFEELEVGLYVLTQQEAAEGFSPVQPFLVTVPITEDGAYVYDVDASPKLSLTPSETAPSDATTAVATPTDPTLPKTGQLNWPVPVLAVCGLILFTVGAVIYFCGRKKAYEK